jgi:hypothetical protein
MAVYPLQDTQEAYEAIRAWLARPNATKAYDDYKSQCLYLTDTGNKCAIGGILPAELLSLVADSEGNVGEIMQDCDDVAAFFRYVDPDFLIVAQEAHDHAGDYGNFQADALDRLDQAARGFGLEVRAGQ